jgi:LuxR family maltose regulon positive regulatory protein
MLFPPVVTKLHLPQPKAALVARPRLLDRLRDCQHHKLTLISSAAGSGKSTLLSQWARQAEIKVAWLSLDANDNSPLRFLTYFIYALQTIQRDIGGLALELLNAPQHPDIMPLMAGLVNEINTIDHMFVLVFDDYHLIEDKSIHETVSLLLHHLPRQMRLIVAARSDPPLPLAWLRSQGELLEVRSTELRFDPEESALFLNGLMQLDLWSEDVARLIELTEGWVTGLQLAALAVQGRVDKQQLIEQFTGNHRYIFDYLGDEVFDRQPKPVQNFLLRTAVLDRLNSDLCQAVVGEPEAQQMLLYLEKSNLFIIPLDDQQYWFRYHHLFADFLVRRQRQQLPADQIEALHRRAAAWYEGAGLIEEALQHLLVIKNYERMAQILEQYVSRIWTHGQMPTLRKWLKALPEQWVYSSPRLALSLVSTLIDTQYLDEAERYLRQAEATLNIAEQQGTDLYHEAVALRCAIAYFRHDAPTALSLVNYLEQNLPEKNLHLRTFFALNLGSIYAWSGQIDKATTFLREAIRSGQVGENIYLAFLSSGQLGILQMEWGQLYQAHETFQQALGLFKQPLPITGWIYIYLAGLLYEWNDLDAAAAHLATSIELYRLREKLSTLVEAYLLLARLKQSQNEPEAVAGAIEEAITLAQAHPAPALLERVLAIQAELALSRGQLDLAEQWSETQNTAPGEIQQRPYEVGRTLITLSLAQGRPVQALALLEPLLVAAKAEQQISRMIQLMLRQALALQQQEQTGAALTSLAEALRLARPGGYIRTFVDAGPTLAALLRLLLEPNRQVTDLGDRLRGYGRKLLAAFPLEDTEPSQSPASLLTLREIEVLKLIAAGLTNQQIASELIIARGTVKKHIDNLYAKLEAHNRTQAVARARLLKLL